MGYNSYLILINLQAENELLQKEMIRLQMLTLDMIDTIITDAAVPLPPLSNPESDENPQEPSFSTQDNDSLPNGHTPVLKVHVTNNSSQTDLVLDQNENLGIGRLSKIPRFKMSDRLRLRNDTSTL